MQPASDPSWLNRLRPFVATVAAAALPFVGVAAIAWQLGPITEWFEREPLVFTTSVLIAAGAALCAVALLPTHALSLAAGWLLGPWLGPAVAWGTVALATALGFVVGRLSAGPHLVESLIHRPRAGRVHAELATASPRRTATLIALLRLSPAAPFAATNVGLAALGCHWWAYGVGSVAGLAPRVVIVALFGAGLTELDLSRPRDTTLLVVGAVTTVVFLVAVGRVAKRALDRSDV